MSGYLYRHRGDRITQYFYEGGAHDEEDGDGAVGISIDGSLQEALVRAEEHARNNQDVPPGTTMVVTKIEVVTGPNPPISQYKVTVSKPPSS